MSNRAPIVEDGVIAGTYSDKYESKNPLARFLVRRFEQTVDELVRRTASQDVHEVGCGEGHHLERLVAGGRRVRGSDFSKQVIELARAEAASRGLDVTLQAKSIHDLEAPGDAAELVVCLEVLEHLEDPERAVEVLASLAKPWLLVSVPREPLWCAMNIARGKYLRHWGNTPGHLNRWTKRAFLRLLRRHVSVVEVRAPVPWTFALCRSLTP